MNRAKTAGVVWTALVGWCFALPATAAGIQFQSLTVVEALQQAQAEGKMVFVDYYATWCGPCQYLSTEVFPDDAVGAFYNQAFVCVQVESKDEEAARMALAYNIEAYPTLLYLAPDGSLVQKHVGAGEADQLLAWGQQAANPRKHPVTRAREAWLADSNARETFGHYLRVREEQGLKIKDELAHYRRKFHPLDLEQEVDFFVFSQAPELADSALVDQFLKRAAHFHHRYGVAAGNVVIRLLETSLTQALWADSWTQVENTVERIYPAYLAVFKEDAFKKSKLLQVLKAQYDEQH